ncbi:MAG: 50S ribosomal protein L33 [Polyangiales bacterium]
MSERIPVTLVCSVCGSRNYRTTRARKVGSKALELKKHCPTCKAHTLHKETK